MAQVFCVCQPNSETLHIKRATLAVIPAGLAFMSINIYAATEGESKPQSVKPNQLPIYCVPPLKSRYVEEDPGHLQVGFSTLRKTTSHYVEWCKDAYVFVKNGIMDSIQFGKGSRIKKIAYPLGLTTLAISVCYPAQSVVLAKITGKKIYAASHQTYEAIGSLWTKNSSMKEVLLTQKEDTKPGSYVQQVPEPAVGEDKSAEIKKTTLESEVKSKPLVVTDSPVMKIQSSKDPVPLPADIKVPNVISDVAKTAKFKLDPRLMDHGQSSPEDVDMYSTRS
ncbi:MICOS complex subunit MIC27 isoform X3 [Gopherus flavomarginatus]|uniref:MICOS complex subunit MIC27 isoform X3 n=1 Tax=Gopherus flavomarginatus TaxID=286002 RepID=UPI0021CC214F|nr:MICOS complex subunit MIC27 isoform X3 [Gopherus flavomarginatus]